MYQHQKLTAVLAIMVSIVLLACFSVSAAPEQVSYPDPNSWMYDCPTAPRADYIAYHRVPVGFPGENDWCNLVVDRATQNSIIYTVASPLEGIGLTAFHQSWDSSALDNEVVVSTLQTPAEDQAHLTALYAVIDARIALAPGSGPSMAEFLALEARVTTAEADLVAAQGAINTLQAQVAALQTDAIALESDVGVLQAETATLNGLTLTLSDRQATIYDSLKAFFALFDPNR
jgi:hypothetical protein